MIRSLCISFILLAAPSFSANIALVSMAVGNAYKQAVQMGINSKKLYCRMHGYDFICCEETLDPKRPVPWSKIRLLENVMKNRNYTWIFWSDADSMIMNFSTPLEQFIDENYNLIIGKDKNNINSGQFLIKNCPWSRNLLSKIYLHEESIDHPHWEQQALILELEESPSLFQSIKIVSQRLFNSYPSEIAGMGSIACYLPGDFIVHFPGIRDLSHLNSLMDKYKNQIGKNPEFTNLNCYLQKAGFHLSPHHSEGNEGF